MDVQKKSGEAFCCATMRSQGTGAWRGKMALTRSRHLNSVQQFFSQGAFKSANSWGPRSLSSRYSDGQQRDGTLSSKTCRPFAIPLVLIGLRLRL